MAKPLILLADDSAIMHRAVALALKNSTYELLTCDNGPDALRLAQERRPAVLLADVEMPGMSGTELCEKVRGNPALRATKVILLCGSFDQVDEERLKNARADGRLWKPFESHVLLALLDTLLKAPQARLPDPTLPGTGRPPPPGRSGRTLEEATLAPAEDFAAKLANETFGHVDTLEQKRLVEKTLPERSIPAEGFELTGSRQVDVAHSPEPTLSMEPPLRAPEFPPDPYEVEESPPAANEQPGALWDLPESVASAFVAIPTPPPMAIPTPAVEATVAPTAAPMQASPFLAETRKKIDMQALDAVQAAAPSAGEAELRALVRNEVEKALNAWLRERLEKELALVLAELEENAP